MHFSESAQVSPNNTPSPSLMPTNRQSGRLLLCAMCKEDFANPWELLVHAQTAHLINIYELGADGVSQNNNNSIGHNNNILKRNAKELSIIGMGDDSAELGSDLTMLSPRSSASKEVSHRDRANELFFSCDGLLYVCY